ncbi:hypothetical protein AOCH_006770 [Aspergillus ochraceoroseus]|uniref:Major facilitator superfamily (MFS) profile domain-containing protein n=2 Tax=Aspergillus ochraceoroseus TaxID=138278 RepID=A0A0F8X942_9EURO|nr:hypothetical protein AOCH_006770 [Aspergillus ochraceoroseus]
MDPVEKQAIEKSDNHAQVHGYMGGVEIGGDDNSCQRSPAQTEAGVDNDNDHVNQIKFMMIMLGFGMAFVGSQVCALVFAAIVSTVAVKLDAGAKLIWFFSASLISQAVIAPFSGPLADLYGRKPITLLGVLSSMVGMILCAATPNGNGFIAGQTLTGMGTAIQELMAISVITELVPTQSRGYYSALLVSSFLPFAPASLYGQLIARANWRYCGCMIAIWNFLTAVVIGLFYNPPPRSNSAGLSHSELLRRIDYIGGLIVTAGILLFLIGLNWGGQAYPWTSAQVIACVVIGGCLVLLFLAYEAFWAPFPMFPRRLLLHPRSFVALMIVIFMAGINYIPILFFWVLQSIAVYDSSHLQAGIRTLPFGFCILGGAIISGVMLSFFKQHLRVIMTCFCVIQTIAIACMTTADTHNINTVWGPLTIGLLSVGGLLVPNQVIVTVISPDDLIATATSLTVAVRAVGQVVGTSILYSQFVSKITSNAYKYFVPAALEVGIYNTTILADMVPTLTGIPFSEYVQSLPEVDTAEKWNLLHEAVLMTFDTAFQKVYLISIAFGAIAIVASLFLGDLSKLMDRHIAVPYF